MTEYRYVSTDVVTGRLLADEIPLHVQSASRQLGQVGALSGYVELTGAGGRLVAAGALEPRRTLLWMLEDGYPVWHGVLWDQPMTTMAGSQMQVAAQGLESLMARRMIRDVLTFTGLDYADVWRGLLEYATNPAVKGPGAPVAGLSAQPTGTNVSVSTSYAPGDMKNVGAAMADLETAGDFETTFEPVLDGSGGLATLARLAPRLGQPYQNTGVQLTYPGNLADYGWPRMGSQGANTVIATAPANTSAGGTWTSNTAGGRGVDSADLLAGYPLLEAPVQYSGAAISAQAQIDAYADGHLSMVRRSPTIPGAVVDMSAASAPLVKALGLGDQAALLVRSPRHPARADGSPGLQQIVRIIGWQVTPPDQGQDGKITLTLGDVAS